MSKRKIPRFVVEIDGRAIDLHALGAIHSELRRAQIFPQLPCDI